MKIPTRLQNTAPIGDQISDPGTRPTCTRCGGLLVSTFCISPDEGTCDFQIPVAKCLQCGDVIDPVILKHRLSKTMPQPNPKKRRQFSNLQAISTRWTAQRSRGSISIDEKGTDRNSPQKYNFFWRYRLISKWWRSWTSLLSKIYPQGQLWGSESIFYISLT